MAIVKTRCGHVTSFFFVALRVFSGGGTAAFPRILRATRRGPRAAKAVVAVVVAAAAAAGMAAVAPAAARKILASFPRRERQTCKGADVNWHSTSTDHLLDRAVPLSVKSYKC